MERLGRDAGLRASLGKAGRATAEQFYHGQRLARELVAVYREIGGARIKKAEAGLTSWSLPR
jgi:hypothetical protein